MRNIFSGIKIIDCTRVFSGPFATRYFSDYGAEVIKIETLENYDESRNFSPLKNGISGYFEILNRGKKSINLNLKNRKDLRIFYDLIKDSDIFVENFSSETKKRLKIDYETLKNINPRLIYGSLNGYGESLDKKAYDVIIQAESGLASLNGENRPMKNATAIVDTFSGLTLSLAVTSLLYEREKKGIGGFVNIPMIAAALQMTEQNIIETSISGKNPNFVGNGDNAIFPFGFYKVLDGEISIAIGNDNLWNKFVENIIPELVGKYRTNDIRIRNKELLKKKLEEKFLKFKLKDLCRILDDLGIPNSKINTMKDILENDFYKKEKYIKEIRHPKLGRCCVPYEFIKYNKFKIEDIKFAPYIKK